jgi:hypothetical protein
MSIAGIHCMTLRAPESPSRATLARVHIGEMSKPVRASRWVACLALMSLAVGCGGDSSVSSEATGGQAGSEPRGAGGDEGDAGDGAGGTSGGTTPSRGGSAGGGPQPTGGVGPQPAGGFGGAPLPSTGGVPWMGGGPSVGPPIGCRVGSQSLSPGSCSIGFECESGYLSTYCYDPGSFGAAGSFAAPGRPGTAGAAGTSTAGAAGTSTGWGCTCSSSAGTRTYELSGVEDLAACEAVTDLCLSDDPTPSGPVECEPRIEARTASQCQVQRVCKQELEEGSGVSVSTTNGAYCVDDGTGRLLCTCENQRYQYYVEGNDGMTACDALLDYCDDAVAPTYGDAEDCRPQYQASSADHCEVQSNCLRKSEIDDGIYLVQNDYVQSTCRAGVDGLAVCTCQNRIGLFELDEQTPLAGVTNCNEAAAVCENIANVEPDGEPVCTTLSQYAQGANCNATLDCAASATVEGATLSLHGYISLSCGADANGWTCSCSSGVQTQTVAVQGETAWDACTNGSKACEDAVEVQFGNGSGFGGGVGMPIPGIGGTRSF